MRLDYTADRAELNRHRVNVETWKFDIPEWESDLEFMLEDQKTEQERLDAAETKIEDIKVYEKLLAGQKGDYSALRTFLVTATTPVETDSLAPLEADVARTKSAYESAQARLTTDSTIKTAEEQIATFTGFLSNPALASIAEENIAT